jgi:hypothetical protein
MIDKYEVTQLNPKTQRDSTACEAGQAAYFPHVTCILYDEYRKGSGDG